MLKNMIAFSVFAIVMAVTGQASAQSPTTPTTGRYGFTGEWHSPDGTLYLRNRVYHPRLRRFLQRDVVTGSSMTPMSLNRYTYVEGNPATWADPSGRQPQKTQCPEGQMLMPGGGCAHENFWYHLANFAAGWGDSITGIYSNPFGFPSPTENLREMFGGADVIDKSSFGYTSGGGMGTAAVTVAGMQNSKSSGGLGYSPLAVVPNRGISGGSARARLGVRTSVTSKGTPYRRVIERFRRRSNLPTTSTNPKFLDPHDALSHRGGDLPNEVRQYNPAKRVYDDTDVNDVVRQLMGEGVPASRIPDMTAEIMARKSKSIIAHPWVRDVAADQTRWLESQATRNGITAQELARRAQSGDPGNLKIFRDECPLTCANPPPPPSLPSRSRRQ
jgi:RHS repeat-associated protein